MDNMMQNRTFRSGQFSLAVSVWAVSVWGHFGLAVSVWGHFGHDISAHNQFITFVYLMIIGRRNVTLAGAIPIPFEES